MSADLRDASLLAILGRAMLCALIDHEAASAGFRDDPGQADALDAARERLANAALSLPGMTTPGPRRSLERAAVSIARRAYSSVRYVPHSDEERARIERRAAAMLAYGPRRIAAALDDLARTRLWACHERDAGLVRQLAEAVLAGLGEATDGDDAIDVETALRAFAREGRPDVMAIAAE